MTTGTMTRWKRFVALAALAFAGLAGAQSVFDMPRLFPRHCFYLQQFIGAAQRGDRFAAETAARAAAKLFPNDANWHYNIACVCALDGRQDEALEMLAKAVELGFTDARKLRQDTDLVSLWGTPRFAEIEARAKALAENPPTNATLGAAIARDVPAGGEAVVDAADTQWEWDPMRGGYMTTLLRLHPGEAPAADAYAGPCADLVRPWLAANPAAYSGVLYVNRDEDLAAARYEAFPGLTPVVYGEEAVRAGAHKGEANGLFFSGVRPLMTVGNSIMALPATPFWRSLPRKIATTPNAIGLAARLAAANQLYVYDATLDCSRAGGDLLVGNNIAFVPTADLTNEKPDPAAAQRGITELILAAFAAFTPQTKEAIARDGLLVPTVQRLLRQSQKGVPDYFGAAAHPPAFDPQRVDAEAFLKAAHALTPETLPPPLALSVRMERAPLAGVEFFEAVNSETLADTPQCITRVFRGTGRWRRLTVAAQSPGCDFRWFVVGGDPGKIRITPLTSDGALVTLEVAWHAPFDRDGLQTRRADIACVAVRPDGTASAPAFVSFRFLANERRVYDGDRLVSVDYSMPEGGFVYEDPLLTTFKNWRDDYLYDDAGKPLGWTRRRPGQAGEDRFDTHGRRVAEANPDGSPKAVAPVRYFPRQIQGTDGRTAPVLELIQMDAGAVTAP